jgi:integrase
MAELALIQGGGERAELVECRICGVPYYKGREGCRILARHLRHLELLGRSALTVYARRRMLNRLGHFLPVPVADASAEQLYQWRASLRVADATAATYVSDVKMFFSWLTAEGYRPDDPAAHLPVPATPRRLPRPISEADLMRALDAAPARIRLMIVLAAWAGLRTKELARLRREHLKDTAAEPVVVVVIGAAKGRRERAIPLCEFAVAEIQAANLPRKGYVFPRLDGQRGPLSPWMVSKLIGEHLHDCGISATAHQLRHRCLSQAYNTSLDVVGTQELAGHASLSSTTGYVKLSGRRTREIVAGLPVPS